MGSIADVVDMPERGSFAADGSARSRVAPMQDGTRWNEVACACYRTSPKHGEDVIALAPANQVHPHPTLVATML